jgi:galacturan 1,4-alpha-galacturonidase
VDLNEKLAKTKRLLNGEEEFKIDITGEEGVHQMKALLGLSIGANFSSVVLLPFTGRLL